MNAPLFEGLTGAEQKILNQLWKKIHDKATSNETLNVYYDAQREFRNLGISIPPQMAATRAALGWPAKAVTTIARKHLFEGFSLNGETDPYGINEVLIRANLEQELVYAFNATYKHCCSFMLATAGNPDMGEPEILLEARDARWTSGIWDRRRHELTAVLAVEKADEVAVTDDMYRMSPSRMVMYLPEWTIYMAKTSRKWAMERVPNTLGRVPVELLPNDPQLNRFFGRSRITREVRYLSDAALRTMVRAETTAEFFAAPQRYVLGAPEDAFVDMDKWSAIIGRLTVLEANGEGDVPTMGQFPQMTMAPHLEMYRQLAQNFCSETDLPTSTVGIFADNPASAEAMQAAESRLSDAVEAQWKVFAPALRRLAQNLVMARDGLREPPKDSWNLTVNWTPARYVSPQAASDYIVKVVQALPQVANTTVALRRAGFTTGEIEQMQGEMRRDASRSLIEQLNGVKPAEEENANP